MRWLVPLRARGWFAYLQLQWGERRTRAPRALYNAKNQTCSVTVGGRTIPMAYQDASQVKRIVAGSTEFDYNVLGLSNQTEPAKSSSSASEIATPENTEKLFTETVDTLTQATEIVASSTTESEASAGETETSSTEASSTETDPVSTSSDTSGGQTESSSASSGACPQNLSDGLPNGPKLTSFYLRDNLGTLVSETTEAGAAPGTYYYLFDGLGSVVGLTNAAGALSTTYTYEPYGKQTSAEKGIANPWRFAAGYFDSPTAFTKFGTRYYDPNVMRWTQQDPERGHVKDPISLNPYLYAACSPTNFTDPTGRQTGGDCGAATAALVGAGILAVTGLLAVTGPIVIAVAVGSFLAVGGTEWQAYLACRRYFDPRRQ